MSSLLRNHLVVVLVLALGLGVSYAETYMWVDPPPTGSHMNAVAFFNTNDVVAVGNGGNAIWSNDGGDSWQAVATVVNQSLESLSVSGSIVISVGGGTSIVRSTTKGVTWEANPYAAGKELKKATAAFIGGTTVLAVGKSGHIVRNTQSGDRTPGPGDWAQVDGGVPPDKDLHAIAHSGNNVVVVGDRDGGPAATPYNIVYSSNAGAGPWKNVGPATGGHLYDVAFVNASTVIAVGAGGVILRNTDSGDNGGPGDWGPPTLVQNNPGAHLYHIAVQGTNVVATGTGGVIMYSSNSGDTWNRAVVTPDPGQDLNDLATSASLMMAVGPAGTILTSVTNGATWTSEISNPVTALNGVDIINPVVIVGQNGTVFQSTTTQAAAASAGPGGAVSGFVTYERDEVEVPFGGEWLVLLGLLGQGLRWMRSAAIHMRNRTGSLCDLIRADGARLRFGLLFAAILVLIAAAFPLVQEGITHWYLQPMSVATAALLNVAGIDARLSMDSISQGFCLLTMPRTTFRIILECTGIFTAFILVAAMLATPSTWSRRITGVLAVIPAAFAYGVVRLVVLGSIGYHLPYAIQFFHLWLMALANTAFAMILWHYWSREAWSHA